MFFLHSGHQPAQVMGPFRLSRRDKQPRSMAEQLEQVLCEEQLIREGPIPLHNVEHRARNRVKPLELWQPPLPGSTSVITPDCTPARSGMRQFSLTPTVRTTA